MSPCYQRHEIAPGIHQDIPHEHEGTRMSENMNTPSDPRVGEIQARLANPKAATDAQFGDVLRIIWATYYFGADLRWHNARTGDVELPETLVEEIEASEGDWGWLDGRRDVAYLLAQLQARDEALWRVERLAARWATLADGDRYYARHIRAALDGAS